MSGERILIVGESWVSSSTHVKGWDFFSSSVYEEGHEHLSTALTSAGYSVEHMPAHIASARFPSTMEELSAYDVVIISDIGANTLLLHPSVWLKGETAPNRLALVRDWVLAGGRLVMCGGYLSFSGIYGSARYAGTPIEAVLPVDIARYDDRIEAPQGARVMVCDPNHPIVDGLAAEQWPALLGYNEVTLSSGAHLVASIDGHPFLAVGEYGAGRSLVWTSDIGPHWCPMRFISWAGYQKVWSQAIGWLLSE